MSCNRADVQLSYDQVKRLGAGGDEDSLQTPSTGGILFNRAGLAPKRNDEKVDRERAWNNEGQDWTNASKNSDLAPHFIPRTSVVNTRLLCCDCGPTAAQGIFFLNLLCFFVHAVMVFLTYYFAWYSEEGEKNMRVKIYRISANWTSSNPNGYTYTLVDNGMPVDLAHLTASFFLLSAIFHLFAVIVAPFESLYFLYWKQLDDAFAWWRWLEYSASASLMSMGIAIIVGLREQNTLASIFMLHVCTMACGFMTELYSRPRLVPMSRENESTPMTFRMDEKDRPDSQSNARTLYKEGSNQLIRVPSQHFWEGDPLDAKALAKMSEAERKEITAYSKFALHRVDYLNNAIRRLLPHVFGFFPYITAWVLIMYHFLTAMADLKESYPELNVPEWVIIAVWGVLIIFSSFTVVQIVYQLRRPGDYWGTEICYCVLSATAKLFLGVLLLWNVIMADGPAESTLGIGGIEGVTNTTFLP